MLRGAVKYMERDEVYSAATAARLDVWLAEVASTSRSQVQGWVRLGFVRVNGELAKKSGLKIEHGDRISWNVVSEVEASPLARYNFALQVVYEDEHLLVIDKPAGLSMHPGAGNKTQTLANALVGKISGEMIGDRPGIVHRLDKDTTGLVVVAKTPSVHAGLAKQFAARTTSREYLALVLSTPRGTRVVRQSDSGTIDAPIARSTTNRKQMQAGVEGGRKAVTHWQVIERMGYAVLLSVKLETGRTHQIRVHMASVHCPVIGDRLYGDFDLLPQNLKASSEAFARQALHARLLGFNHPVGGKRLEFESPMPEDMKRVVDEFRAFD
jgi:23S rRNA pseudouridine1911/1915/1917 synthase